MMEKILLWIDFQLIHFGIAKSLQEKYDFDIYSIIDINNTTKEFFEKQKIVNFKKSWYYRDAFKEKLGKPDISYLKNVEKRLGINLWQLAYSERLFYKFNRYYKFQYEEILSILEIESKFFEKILDEIQPNYLFIKTADWHWNQLLVEICRAKGIKVLMSSISRFGYRAMISSDLNFFEPISRKQNYVAEIENAKGISDLLKYVEKFDARKQAININVSGGDMSTFRRFFLSLKFLLLIPNEEYRQFYANFGRSTFNILINETKLNFQKWDRSRFIDKYFIKKINDGDIPFVYFTLSVEPERTVSIDSPFYNNQEDIVVKIAKSLPVGYKLYVKEHYNMRFNGWRKKSFYKRIMDLPNVKLVHPLVDSKELTKKSSLVITISGTPGSEAVFYEKPAIVFSDTVYSHIPSVFRVKNYEDLPSLIRTALSTKVKLEDVKEYFNLINSNTFEFDLTALYADAHITFYNKSLFPDVKISMKEIELFLKRNNDNFDKLTSEHVKKINQLKESIT